MTLGIFLVRIYCMAVISDQRKKVKRSNYFEACSAVPCFVSSWRKRKREKCKKVEFTTIVL